MIDYNLHGKLAFDRYIYLGPEKYWPIGAEIAREINRVGRFQSVLIPKPLKLEWFRRV